MSDGSGWHVNGNDPLAGASFDHHIKNTCNAIFFDGHVEVVKTEKFKKAVYDPGG